MPPLFVWKKLASAKWEDAWIERLQFVGSTRLAVTTLPNARSLRIEACGLSRHEASALHQQFGGTVTAQKSSGQWLKSPSRAAIRIRDRLVIVDSAAAAEKAAHSAKGRRILILPAAMAFGTGDHATTASCLRLLCDIADEFADREMLDLGTGTGILALAARTLGARRADACDFDPHAIRTARENGKLNDLGGIRYQKLDVTQWTPDKQYAVVTANLFSEVLITAAPAIVRAVQPGGKLILSGILRRQEAECLAAFAALGFNAEKVIHKGKWIAALISRNLGTKHHRART